MVAAAVACAAAVSGPVLAAMRLSVIRPPRSGTLCVGTEVLPHRGGGAYVTSAPCGFYIGRAFTRDRFDGQKRSHHGFTLGRVRRLGLCGWIDPGTLSRRGPKVANGCPKAAQRRLADQYSFGRDFNCRPHACRGPSRHVPISSGCPRTLYFNYVHGRFLDPARGLLAPRVRYRYTTRDRRAVVVLAPRLGWGFLPARCVPVHGS